MKVSILAECATSLRYYLPLLRVLESTKHDVEMFYPIDGSGLHKYNSIVKNLSVVSDRIVRVCPDTALTPVASNKNKINTDVLFTVECVPRGSQGNIFQYNKKFCIQHGTDYTNFIQYADEKTTYIAHDTFYQDDLKNNFSVNAICPSKPIAFWDINKQLDFFNPSQLKPLLEKKIAYLFYPDRGRTSLAKEVILYLSSIGYTVIVKQRRKHQAVEKFNVNNVHVVYDDIWYPSEAVFFPSIADIAIGFSSAAYVDLVPAGVNYIDLALEVYSKCRSEMTDTTHYPGYVKPATRDNFCYIADENFSLIKNEIDRMVKLNKYKNNLQKFHNNLKIGEKFINDIL